MLNKIFIFNYNYKMSNKRSYLPCLIFFLIFARIINLSFSNSCSIINSLTPEENFNLKTFTGANYISITQQIELQNAYKNLNRRLDNYLIELDDSYLLQTNDIEECLNVPANITFNAMNNLWICLKNQVTILNCSKEWELKIGCGTFIQIHRPFDTNVLNKIMLSDAMIKEPFSITLVNICAGTYHLWFVYSVRIGKVIKSIKPIFISYPSCQCN